jgi:hypothetical protein
MSILYILTHSYSLPDITTGSRELTITLDRKDQGAVNLFLDGKLLANKTVPTIASPKIAQDIWFNAQEWSNLDTGFRGTLERFTMYADTLSPEDVAQPIGSLSDTSSKISKLKSSMQLPESSSSLWAALFPLLAVFVFLLYLLRRKKGALMAIPEYVNRLPELASSMPLLAGRIPELNMSELCAFAKTVPERAMELADRISWFNHSEPKYEAAATEDDLANKEAPAEDGFHDTELGVTTPVSPAEEELEDPRNFQ